MMPRFGDVGGVAYYPGRVSASVPNSRTVAHELGHNMVLGHAPCGGPPAIDPQFPNRYGRIGSWGATINQVGELAVVHPDSPDVMGYCWNDWWISGYNVGRALRHRLKDEGVGESRAAPAPKSLLLSGGTGPDGDSLPGACIRPGRSPGPPGWWWSLSAERNGCGRAGAVLAELRHGRDRRRGRTRRIRLRRAPGPIPGLGHCLGDAIRPRGRCHIGLRHESAPRPLCKIPPRVRSRL